GGALVIGKEQQSDSSFLYSGLSPEQVATFETTKVAQWVNSHFKPDIRLSCHTIELHSKSFVVITVAEFSEHPVICTKAYQAQDGKVLLEAGSIYVRTPNASSSRLQTPEQLASLIGRAVTKQQDRLREILDSVLAG